MNSDIVVTASRLRTAVHFPDLIEPVAHAFQAVSAGHADSGLIVMFPAGAAEDGDVYVKSGTLRGHSVYIVKVSPWFAANVEERRPQGGFIGVFDSRTGHTLALLDDEHYLSDIRTAAAGAVVARTLAPARVDTALVVGSGVQAYWQPQALHRERPYRTLLIWARNPGKADALRARLVPAMPDVDIDVVRDLEPAVRRADVVLTATQAREPLIHGDWLHAGQHITAIGADDATKCELDATALLRARVYVDARDTARDTGEVHRAIQAGRYSLDNLAGELGEALAGTVPARTGADEITIATLAGLGVQDLVAAEVALQKLAATRTPA